MDFPQTFSDSSQVNLPCSPCSKPYLLRVRLMFKSAIPTECLSPPLNSNTTTMRCAKTKGEEAEMESSALPSRESKVLVCNREALTPSQHYPELGKQKPLPQWKLLEGKCIPFPRAAKSLLTKKSQSNEGAGKHTGNYKIVGLIETKWHCVSLLWHARRQFSEESLWSGSLSEKNQRPIQKIPAHKLLIFHLNLLLSSIP